MPTLKQKKKATPDRNGSALDAVLLDLLPSQGQWSEDAYLWLTDSTNKLIEFTDGQLEVLPMPTDNHQAIADLLFSKLKELLDAKGGKVRFAPLRLRIREGKFREPDLLAHLSARDERRQNRYWLGADLVVEIVSEDDPNRDIVEKRKDYAEGKVPEYWIVNPLDETITVLTLGKKSYRKHGVFRRKERMTSLLLPDFSVEVDAVFDAD